MVVLSIFISHFQFAHSPEHLDRDAHAVKLRRRATVSPLDEGIDQYLRIDPATGEGDGAPRLLIAPAIDGCLAVSMARVQAGSG